VRKHERDGHPVSDYYRGRGRGRAEAGRYESFSAHFSEGGKSTKLTSEERAKLPDEAFAIPSERAYPVPTVDELRKARAPRPEASGERHARNALARVSQHGTDYEKRKVCELVERRYPGIHSSECEMHRKK
jgi:hypothetical protein